jgi:hypothetical protein
MPHDRAMAEPDPNDPLVMALLSYLGRHPQAADSLCGVARWWVGGDDQFDLDQVRQALERLVACGALRRQRLADGTEWYASADPGKPAQRRLH